MSKEKVDDGLDPTRWRALFVIALAQLMAILDASIVNIAIPHAKLDLHISSANQQWVVTSYTLAFGSLLLLGGRIADFVGRKKVFIIDFLDSPLHLRSVELLQTKDFSLQHADCKAPSVPFSRQLRYR
ncbi:MAG: MFS transporter [Actinomycetota bacterium]